LIRPVIGIADNGDFWRIQAAFGLVCTGDCRGSVQLRTPLDPTRSRRPPFPSSGLLTAAVAVAVNRVVFSDSLFDLRFAGLVHAALFGAGVLLAAGAAASWAGARRVAWWAALVLVAGDAGYLAYANSLYTEAAGMAFLVLALGCYVHAARAAGGAWSHPLGTAGFFASGLLAICAKPHYATLALPLAFLGGALGRTYPGRRARRVVGLASALLLVAAAVCTALYSRSNMIQKNLYNAVFWDLLGHSHSVADDLVELGLPQAYAPYAGLAWYHPDAGIGRRDRLENLVGLGYGGITSFYLRHPARFADLIGRASREAYLTRIPYLAYSEAASGRAPPRLALWSEAKEALLPRSAAFLICLLVLNAGIVGVKRLRFDHDASDRATSALHAGLLFVAILQFFTAVVGEGTHEITKHLLLFNVALDGCLLMLLAYALRVERTIVGAGPALEAPQAQPAQGNGQHRLKASGVERPGPGHQRVVERFQVLDRLDHAPDLMVGVGEDTPRTRRPAG
jgi:hypothetical protein